MQVVLVLLKALYESDVLPNLQLQGDVPKIFSWSVFAISGIYSSQWNKIFQIYVFLWQERVGLYQKILLLYSMLLVAWWFATYNVEFAAAMAESTSSSGESSIIAITRRVVASTIPTDGSRRRNIVAACANGRGLCSLWVWRRRTNRRPCCPSMSNPWPPHGMTVLDDETIEWLAQHLPRGLVRPSSGYEELTQKERVWL